MGKKDKYFIIIDSNSIIHRAFHALPPLTTKKGEQVNAIYGFLLVFLKAIKDFQPDYIAAAFDLPFPTFRHKKFKEYKAQRPPTPKELYQQIPKIKEILKAFNIQIFEKQGFEADDIMGTLAWRAAELSEKENLEIIIVSGDLDILQLIDKKIKVYALRKGVKDTVLYDEKLVREKFQGLPPEDLVDFKALRGDPSDNIPGVPGVGEKTAIKLIKEFSSLEGLYEQINNNSENVGQINLKLKENLIENKNQAFLSKALVQIKKDVSIDFNLSDCSWQNYDKEKITHLLKTFEFYSLIDRLPLSREEKERKREEKRELTLW